MLVIRHDVTTNVSKPSEKILPRASHTCLNAVSLSKYNYIEIAAEVKYVYT